LLLDAKTQPFPRIEPGRLRWGRVFMDFVCLRACARAAIDAISASSS
jgi:hypothetical protein